MVPVKIKADEPVLVIPKPVPEITPDNVTFAVVVWIVLFAVSATVFVSVKAVLRLMLKVPPPRVIALLEEIDPDVEPFPNCRVPALMMVPPV